MFALRRSIEAVGGLYETYAPRIRGWPPASARNSQTLFLTAVVSLVLWYMIDFSLGGESGSLPYTSTTSQASSTRTIIDEVPPSPSPPPATNDRNSTTATTEPDGEGEAETSSGGSILLQLYVAFWGAIVIMVAFTLVVTVLQYIIDRLRGRNRGFDDDDDDDDENGSALGMLFRNGMLRRELTPSDYETLLRLDNNNFNEDSEADHGLPQEYIDRCPVMVATQNQIDNMTQDVTNKSNEGEGEGAQEHKDYACTVCLADYEPGDHIRTLPCMHNYHTECIDPWLRERGDCPICKLRLEDMT